MDGQRRDRFQNAAELQNYSGIAPVTQRSGKKCWVHWRWQCPKFLRQTPQSRCGVISPCERFQSFDPLQSFHSSNAKETTPPPPTELSGDRAARACGT